MVNQWTSMPNPLFNNAEAIRPQRHDRLIQAWPILYHYTGWKDVQTRYKSFEKTRRSVYVKDWFLQTAEWQKKVVSKASDRPPEKIQDLRVVNSSRDGIKLSWTSPRDDGPTGKAFRYFIKYSDKPIVPFALTDNPQRVKAKQRIVEEVETAILKNKPKNRNYFSVSKDMFTPEKSAKPLYDPKWHQVNAFWMAEHVDGEPDPGPAGQKETFTVNKLNPHNWFGLMKPPGLKYCRAENIIWRFVLGMQTEISVNCPML